MKILVTGCQGFIGSSIGRRASEQGWSLAGLSRSATDASWPGDHYQADVALDDLSPLIREEDPAVVVHAAGSSSVGGSFTSPMSDLRASVGTWANLLGGILAAGVDPLVVFISSAAVYGTPRALPIPETAPRDPISPYGYHKMLCEIMGEEYARCFGLRILVCRLFSVLGPQQRRLLPWEVYAQLADSKCAEVTIQGSGDTTRDYTHVDDVAEAITLLLRGAVTNERGTFTQINVASGTEVPIQKVAESFCTQVGSKPIQFQGLARRGDPDRWCADVTVLRSMVPSWEPRDFDAAVQDCVLSWSSSNLV